MAYTKLLVNAWHFHFLSQLSFDKIRKKKKNSLLGKSNATVFNKRRRKEDIYASLVLKTKTPPLTARLKQQFPALCSLSDLDL